MPLFLCPCCGESYVVPLAVCEFILEARAQQGWTGNVAPARCLACQMPLGIGDSVILRGGVGVSQQGESLELTIGSQAVLVEVSTWDGEGTIFLVRLANGDEVFVTRAQLSRD